ncbi:MAG: T9SS type A sorting domain-containing protein [Rhodothermales bacterium]|nr:T9SS type A sorting domain-containing protein [Rhodothermales bacterium]
MKTPVLLFAFVILCGTVQADPYLRVLDPDRSWDTRQGTIEQAFVSVRPLGIYMEIGLYLTFSSRGSGLSQSKQLEVELMFDLPEGSMVTDSWLWVGDEIMRAYILDQWTAAGIYEGIVNRRRDPSILFKRGPTRYELRVYPMLGSETRQVKITYLVPAAYAGSAATVPLPVNLLDASKYPVPELKIIAWPAEFSGKPGILESQISAPFVPDNDPDFGRYYRLRLDRSALDATSTVTVSVPQPFHDGVQLSVLDNAGAGYYQLVVRPSQLLGQTQSRRVAVLVDHDRSNSSLSRQAVMNEVRSALQTYLTDDDFFNIIVSQIDIRSYSDSWVPADSASIETAFATVGPPAEYSSLPSLLGSGIHFVQANGSAGTLMLVSASDQFQDHETANDLIADLSLGSSSGALQIVDYQDIGVDQIRIGGIWYRGNGYLYTNLAKLTGGQYESLSGGGTNFPSLLRSAIVSSGESLTAVDVYTDLASGFTYGRHTSASGLSIHSTDKAITQMGKFVGLPPWEVTFSGIHRGAPFSISVPLSDDVVVHADSVIETAWVGRQIEALESGTRTNDVINEIVGLSTSYRILSEFTAFLALEPSDTTQACASCRDETQLTEIESEDLPTADSLLSIYPNPFSTTTTIEIVVPREIEAGTATLSIYDVMGRAIRRFDIRSGVGTAQKLTWDGTASDSRRVAAGVYFIVLRTGKDTRTARVVRL